MINEIFKTPLYQTELKLDNKAMAIYCLQHSKKDKGRTISNSGGYQSNDIYDDIPVFRNLFLNITEHSNKMAQLINLKGPLKIDNAWININGYKDSNISHIHNYCMLSGVYYVKTPKNCGNLKLVNPASPTMEYDWNNNNVQHKFNNYTSAKWIMPAYEGVLYIFPSWLEHYVTPNMSKEKRISISFNIIL
tara:strand:+ start:1119 stop:1691 length:573 start_codon:yes stop_codon:yes gene_type:complete